MSSNGATQAAYLNFDETPLYFEAVMSEGSEGSATPTEHVVEQGANVSDHVRAGLDTVSLEIFISNTPLADLNNMYPSLAIAGVVLDVPSTATKIYPTPGSLINAAAGAIQDAFVGKPTYKAVVNKSDERMNVVKDIFSKLDQWRSDGVVGQVMLPWKTFDSVVLTKVSMSRTPDLGNAAKLTLEFQEIRLVESKMVTAPKSSEPRGKNAVAKGRQPTDFVREPAEKKKSVMKKVSEGRSSR